MLLLLLTNALQRPSTPAHRGRRPANPIIEPVSCGWVRQMFEKRASCRRFVTHGSPIHVPTSTRGPSRWRPLNAPTRQTPPAAPRTQYTGKQTCLQCVHTHAVERSSPIHLPSDGERSVELGSLLNEAAQRLIHSTPLHVRARAGPALPCPALCVGQLVCYEASRINECWMW